MALALGALAFILNGVPVSAGWGVEFVFGSAIPFLALRILPSRHIVFASSLGALRTVLLWNHYYAWIVWTAEAVVLTRFTSRKSPVRVDILFWILAGTPMLSLTYGMILHFDANALRFVILKQVANGIFNVAVAEIFYAIIVLITASLSERLRFRAVTLESLLLSMMACVVIMPTIILMRLDAPMRQSFIDERIETQLSQSIERAVNHLQRLDEMPSQETLFDGLEAVRVGRNGIALLLLQPGHLKEISGSWHPAPWVLNAVQNVQVRGRVQVLTPQVVLGTAAMSVQNNSVYVLAREIPEFPGARIVAIVRAREEIARQQLVQSDLLATLLILLLAIMVPTFLLVKRSQASFANIGKAVSHLSTSRQANVRGLVVEELSAIARSVASANSVLERDQQALVSYRRRLDSLAENAPLVIYAIEMKGCVGKVAFVSRTVGDVLGYSEAEVMIEGWWEASLHPEDKASCLAASSGLEPGAVQAKEYRIRHKLGHYIWVYDCLSADHSGAEAIGILIDVTDKKVAAEKLMHANKMESLGRMAAGVAHELNQPLNFIRLAAQNLRMQIVERKVVADKALSKLDRIVVQVDRASVIVNEIKTFGTSHVAASGIVNVGAVIREVADLLDSQMIVSDIRFGFRATDSKLLIHAQSGRLEQVLINLILNGRDAIEAKRRSNGFFRGRITLVAISTGESIKIIVQDNGIGVEEGQINFLFDPFYTTKGPKEGTGLGLSVAYSIITEMGGKIHFVRPRIGARFVITLPRIIEVT